MASAATPTAGQARVRGDEAAEREERKRWSERGGRLDASGRRGRGGRRASQAAGSAKSASRPDARAALPGEERERERRQQVFGGEREVRHAVVERARGRC